MCKPVFRHVKYEEFASASSISEYSELIIDRCGIYIGKMVSGWLIKRELKMAAVAFNWAVLKFENSFILMPLKSLQFNWNDGKLKGSARVIL